MFAFYMAFSTQFPHCRSLRDIQTYLRMRSTCRTFHYELMNDSILDDHLKELARTIALHTGSTIEEFKLILQSGNIKKHLCFIDCIGKSVNNIMRVAQNRAVIAGSFALFFYMILRGLHYYPRHEQFAKNFPSDIDVFCPEEFFEDLMDKLKSDGFLWQHNSHSEYAYQKRSKKIVKTDLLHCLGELRSWKKYDWDLIMKEFSPSFRPVILDIQEVYYERATTEPEFAPLNIIEIGKSIPVNCTSDYECPLDCFAMNVLLHFDMLQCAIAIIGTSGTFYPQFLMLPESKLCIETGIISFGYGSFSHRSSQLTRIKKYQERGFGLPTLESLIIRL